MSILHLTLKKKWFDMIASGEKKEEYREIKKHWISRLCNNGNLSDGFQYYDAVIFRNGYSGGAPLMSLQLEWICIGVGHPEWGAEPGKEYFVIKLGDII